MAKKINFPRLLLAILISFSTVACFGPFISKLLAKKDVITVRVLERNEYTGGSEVWIASPDGSVDLPNAPRMSIWSGNLEYRIASEYGYACNFLISFGDNVGSALQMETKGALTSENGFMLYKHPLGGVIEIEYKGKVTRESLYAGTPELVSPQFGNALWRFFAEKAIELVCAVGLCIFVYHFLPCLWKREEGHAEKIEAAVHGLPMDGLGILPPDRNSSIDLARTTAAFLVVSVHSFHASGYYNAQLVGEKMFLLTFLRWIALDCVPLFMLITGYLCIYKKNIGAIYKHLISPLLLFVLVMLVRIVFFEGILWKSEITLKGILGRLLQMDLAWYLNMYIGLVLLMPFLNRMWEHTQSQEKQILLIVLLLLTSGRSVFGHYFSEYWIAIYPITYYFTGAYLRENPISLPKRKIALLLAAVTLLETVITFTNGATVFDWAVFGGYACDYPSFPALTSTVLLFSLLSKVNVENKFWKNFLALCGKNTLGIYLVSVAITDKLIHPPLQRMFTTPQDYMWVQLPAALISFLLALAVSVLLNMAIQNVLKIIAKEKTQNGDPSIET